MTAHNHSSSNPKHFCYYSKQGELTGETWGQSPERSLYASAHYVIANEEEMLKNLDPMDIIQSDLDAFRKELINIPLSDMSAILHLNRVIKALTYYLDQQRQVA